MIRVEYQNKQLGNHVPFSLPVDTAHCSGRTSFHSGLGVITFLIVNYNYSYFSKFSVAISITITFQIFNYIQLQLVIVCTK